MASIQIIIVHTVGENIIATTKIRNNYGAIQSLIFPILLSPIILSSTVCMIQYTETRIFIFWILSLKINEILIAT